MLKAGGINTCSITPSKESMPKKPNTPQKHTAMKLPPPKTITSAPGQRNGPPQPDRGGKPHKTPEHLMGKARKVH